MADCSGVVRAFEQFAADCRDSSPLYERLSLAITRDEDMLSFAVAHASQFSREDREKLTGMQDALGAKRDLVWISAELGGRPTTVDVVITSWLSRKRSQELVAHAHPHGRWLEWLRNTS